MVSYLMLRVASDNRSMHNPRLYFFTIIASLLLLAGVRGAGARDLAVVGTGDGLDVLRAVSEAYRQHAPGVQFGVPPSIGSGGAIAAVGANREILGRVARQLTSTEAASGIHYHPVFSVASAFIVHSGVPVRNLNAAQLQAIFTGETTNWKEVGGPDLRIRVVRREDADSSVATFRATLPEFAEIRFTERSKLALTTQEAIDSVRQNLGAIGFASYSTALAAEFGVLSINGTAPTDKDYPARTVLALIYKPERIDEDIRRYIDFLSGETARRIILDFGARPTER
jgi:phosphate transport system substrate-binding protein